MTTSRGLLARIRARLHKDERGFTMIEVLAAILIFGVLITGIASMQSTTLNLIRNNRHRAVAANLASEEMDTVRSTQFASLPVGQSVSTRTVDGISYTVTRESEWIPNNASAGACDAPPGSSPAYLRVNVAVTWPVMSGVEPVQANTIVTPPVGTYDENTGHLGVKVLDRDGQPIGGIPVAIAGPQAQSQSTSSDGCVFFAFLPPGSYTATVSETGYVSDQGVAAPAQGVAVVQGAIASLLFLYDRAATLDLTLLGKDAGHAAPAGVPVVLFNTSILPSGTLLNAGSGSPRVISGLFPYAAGFSVWAGSCADADPAFHDGGARPDPIAVEPGTTTAGPVLMYDVFVTVTVGGLPSSGRTVTAVHAADAGCPAGASYTIGQTDALGEIRFALPYGTWQIQVDGSTVDTPTLAPTDPTGPYVVTVIQ